MRILDRYLLKSFIKILLFSIITFIAVYVIIDMVEHLDKFIDRNVPVMIITLYYVYSLPEIIKLILPVAMMMASLFSVGQLARRNELTAIKASGQRLSRVYLPILILAFFISLAALFWNDTAVPIYCRKKYDLDRTYLKKLPAQYRLKRNNIPVQDSPNRYLYIEYYDGETNTGYQVDIITQTSEAITERIFTREMQYTTKGWVLKKGVRYTFEANKVRMMPFEEYSDVHLNIRSDDMEGIQIRPEEMRYIELSEFIERLKRIGGNTRRWLLEQHQKISFPFSNIIIVLFGLSLASTRWRGGVAAGFGIGIFFCFVFYGVNITLGPTLGHYGVFPPIISAWFGNLLFGILGIWTFHKTRT